jgi:integrase
MATIKLYKKSKRQPCYVLRYKNIETNQWTMKLLHCSREEADQIRKKVEAEYTWFQANPELIKKSTAIHLNLAKEQFLNGRLHVIERSTYKRYQRVFTSFEGFVGNPLVSEITNSTMNDYSTSMLQPRTQKSTTGRSPAGINLDLRHLKAFFRYCHSESMIEKMPKIVMLKEKKRPVYYISRDQFNTWLDSCEILGNDADLVRDIATVVLLTAARISEILNANWDQIDLDKRVIKLFDDQDDAISDKTNSGGSLYLSEKACYILRNYRSNEPGPFPVTYDWFQWRMRKIAIATGFRLRPHDLRKTAGSWLVQDGVDIYQVSKFMRHTSVKVTEKFYTELRPDQYHKTADQMANLF